VEVWVADTGHGIPAHLLPQVTEPFFTTKDPGKGTGLGLAIVAGIVRAHAGTLAIESDERRGTTVRIRLPAP
jgi:signal transduction histidine kinase